MFEPFFTYLTVAGDGTGEMEHIGNYSVTPRIIKYTAASGARKYCTE